MIRFTHGNLLDAPAEALVNTVNEVGVMGKGIALMFKERYPENMRLYAEASRAQQVRIGRMLVTPTGELFPRWIINFPTKKHWRSPSKLEWIEEGLRDFVRVVRELEIRSVAVPPLGCGNGGLAWDAVRPLIEATANELPGVDLLVYEPTGSYLNAPKAFGVEQLTMARALVAELIRRYSVLGGYCTVLEVQKLAYFLDLAIRRRQLSDVLGLQFVADKYGPYADRLRHLLNNLDGSFLHAEKRLSDSRPNDLIWSDSSRHQDLQAFLEEAEAAPFMAALQDTSELIDGFESPLGMELLATVHWLLNEVRIPGNSEAIREALAHWVAGELAAKRKLAMFDSRLIDLALERLTSATA